MFLLLIIIYKEEHLETFLSTLVEVGILNSIVISTQSLEEELAEHVPIFASLKFNMTNQMATKIVLSLIDNEEVILEINKLLMESDVNISSEKIGEILTIPISSAVGRTINKSTDKKTVLKKML